MTTPKPNDSLREKHSDDFMSRWERIADNLTATLSAPEYRAGLERTAAAIRAINENGDQSPETEPTDVV